MTSLYLSTSDVSSALTGGAEPVRWRLAGSPGTAGTARVVNKNTVNGPIAPLLVTNSATAGTDGSAVAWYSDPLSAVTIAGQIVASLWGVESASTANAAPCIGVYHCDASGAVMTTIVDPALAGNQGALEFGTTASAKTCTIAAATVTDTTISMGELLKVTLCIDDAQDQGGSNALSTGRSVQLTINGPVGAAGQSQIAFTETFTSLTQAGYAITAGRPVTPVRDAPSILSGF